SGQLIASQAPNERFEPASLTKLMTAYIAFAAIKNKQLSLTQALPVSEKAWRAQGSRMFIDPKNPVTVEELLRGMIVQSGNDACIALAEAIAGSEESFAQLMNKEAARLGMKNSHFTNSSGLPDAQHYSSAGDLALLASALIRDFPEFYAQLYSMKEYRYNNITQHNRNRLLWLDPNVDGVKTGYTDNAGYCLIASAKRGPRRLLSVVLGTASDSVRAQESLKLLNYGFQFYESVRLYEKNQAVSTLEVWKGSENRLKAGFQTDMFVTLPRGQADKVKADFVSQQPLVAPISAGQRVGTLRVMVESGLVAEYPVVALDSVGIAGYFGRTWDTFRLWFK
ncbi:MAG: D-alanyl-D-alanine carboxypeptidase, partial [Proteobacteria bacterium]|nr:D-alanyl-D-alanine carboxypeptidase [Pseudomonadota bacterium]